MADQRPFFSVVIPTKNRPEYLRDSIQSALKQNFDDFEVVVSDNYNEQPTQDVIAEFKGHPKFRSIRTDKELNMISHWEFATKHAEGKYVLFLADRKIYYQGAFQKIADALKKHPEINAFSLGMKVFNDLENRMGWDVPEYPTAIYNSVDLLHDFLNKNYYGSETKDFLMPKTLNGGYKNDFAQEVRSISGYYFNNPGVTTPDYSSMFINLTLNEKVLHIGGKLMLWQGEHTSNGRNFGAGHYEKYMKSLGLENPYENVSIKAPFIYNLLHVDLQTIKRAFGGNLSELETNWDNYFRTNYWELLSKEKVAAEGVDLSIFRNAFDKALEEHKNHIKNFDKLTVKKEFELPPKQQKFDKIVNFKRHIHDFVAHRFHENKFAQSIVKTHYKSVLEAGGFKD